MLRWAVLCRWMAALAAIFASATGPANATERPEALDRLVRPNDRVIIRAVVASGTRYCTVRVGARSRTAVASGATEVRFSFRVARAPRVRSARVSLTCGSGASRQGILRVRSSARTGGALIDGTIHATAIRPIRRDDASSATTPPPTPVSRGAARRRVAIARGCTRARDGGLGDLRRGLRGRVPQRTVHGLGTAANARTS